MSSPITTRPIGVARWLFTRLWPLVLLVGAWQLWVSARGFNEIVIPRPWPVFVDLVTSPGAYLADTLVTVSVAAIGLVLGLACGLVAAVAAWSSRIISGLVTPAAIALYAVPTLAFLPVIAKIFGYNGRTIIAVTMIIAFFPAFVYVSSGLRHLPAGSVLVFSALGSDRRTRLWRLALPTAVPNLLIAIRVSASTAIIAAVVAEYLMGTNGLGQAFIYSYKRYEMDRAFGIAIVIMALSLLMFSLASRLERWGRARWT